MGIDFSHPNLLQSMDFRASGLTRLKVSFLFHSQSARPFSGSIFERPPQEQTTALMLPEEVFHRIEAICGGNDIILILSNSDLAMIMLFGINL